MIKVDPPTPVVEEPLSASLSVSLTDTEKTDVRRAARRSGLSMSAWARALIREGLTRHAAP